jgi:phage terminase large subunit
MSAAFNWKNPKYDDVHSDRIGRLDWLRENPANLAALRPYYAKTPAQFINDWSSTADPRNPERGLPTVTPFILFNRQIEFIGWVMARWRAGESGICEKSRDCGASWLIMALACTLALFVPGVTIGIGSRKEDLLDRSGDPSSLFHKGRAFLESLPREFLGTWSAEKNANYMRLVFPDTGSAVVGEAGDQIGRGARCSIFFLDEAAFIERSELLDASLAATTNCVIHVSSVNGLGNAFAQKRHSGKYSVFTFHHSADPRKGPEWYARQVATLDPVVVASEIDIDYRGSVSGVLIPPAWIQSAIGAHTALGITPSGTKRGAFDVADEGVDKNAFAGRHGILLQHLESWSGKGGDIYQSCVKVADLCETHGYEYLFYDADGLGSGCRGDFRVLNGHREAASRPQIVDEPFRGSASPVDPDRSMVPPRKNIDMFANAKAQAWWHLRLLFQNTHRARKGEPYEADSVISINPDLAELLPLQMELSQPTYTLNNTGKILVNKTPPGMKSPNLADAVMICFNPANILTETYARCAG